MSMGKFIVIETDKFPILEGEVDELANDGMYGKALCMYLQETLPSRGIGVSSFCCEDWGWWISVSTAKLKMGLYVYSGVAVDGIPRNYAIMPSITNGKNGYDLHLGCLMCRRTLLRLCALWRHCFVKTTKLRRYQVVMNTRSKRARRTLRSNTAFAS